MLPKKYRLSKNKDFLNILKQKKYFRGEDLFLKFVKNDGNYSRFGFIISNKVSKKSATRHKIKRRLNEFIRLNMKRIKDGCDLVFVARPGIETKDYQQLTKEVESLLKNANLWA